MLMRDCRDQAKARVRVRRARTAMTMRGQATATAMEGPGACLTTMRARWRTASRAESGYKHLHVCMCVMPDLLFDACEGHGRALAQEQVTLQLIAPRLSIDEEEDAAQEAQVHEWIHGT